MSIETTNHAKYQTENPVVRRLIAGFFTKLRSVILSHPSTSLLDAGCGEGHTLEKLKDILPPQVSGFDLNPECIVFARERLPAYNFSPGSLYEIAHPNDSFDTVICCEVLEHLEHPENALKELMRVAKQQIVLSVPYEPYFQLGSLMRGKYLATWGNHPEHINHWNPRSFRKFLQAAGLNPTIKVAFPWLIAHSNLG